MSDPVSIENDVQTVSDVACTVCACVCDDLSLSVQNNRIIKAERACQLAEPWFLGQGQRSTKHLASIRGIETSLGEAIAEAAAILRDSRYPLIYGLSKSSTDGQRAAISLADQLGGTIDTTASEGHAPSILAMQEVGESTCTLGEARNRCDLIIYWGADPVTTHPRHMERYSSHSVGMFTPKGRDDRTLIVIDAKPTQTSALADEFVQIDESQNFEALWVLRALVRGVEVNPKAIADLPMDKLKCLAERMRSCRSGVLFFGYGVARQPLGHRNVEALLRLVTDLNHFTRFYARRMRVVGDVSGADSVLCWQTGFPFSVNMSRGYPRYNPGEYSAAEVLALREADAVLFLGATTTDAFPAAAINQMKSIPSILIDHPHAEIAIEPTVRIATSIYGIHHPGTAYRMDEVPIPLRSILKTELPSDREVLRGILEKLNQSQVDKEVAPKRRVE